jgi:NADPH:quinone reductase-like Zn-dependent oxidoreductase
VNSTAFKYLIMASPILESVPETHAAVVIVASRAPLEIAMRQTEAPGAGELLIHVQWTSSTPLDLHQADGGLLVTPPHVMGSSFGGTVVALGPNDPANPDHHNPKLQVGDSVFGFAHRSPREKGHQTYLTTSTFLCSRLPANLTLESAVAVPANLVTAMHTVTADLELPLPWPVQKPEEEIRTAPILLWGAASSVGDYALQVLHHWGYKNLFAVASSKHHDRLKALGAKATFDYNDSNVAEQVFSYVGTLSKAGPRIPYIIDCIGSLEGTLRPLSKIAEQGTKVAIMLPVINVHASVDKPPEYEMDVSKVLPGEWREGVKLLGTRTHFYLQNELFKSRLQSEIVPALLEKGVIQPNKIRVVEGKTLLERAENALSLLRNQALSGEKLVWRVADEDK